MLAEPTDLAYLAGVVDADGYVTATRSRHAGRLYFGAQIAAGCDYRVLDGDNPARMRTDDQTIWIEISYRGFNDFEYGEGPSYDDTFYLPTRKRLASNRGSDWY